MMSNAVKSFDTLTISLNFLHNYFNNLIKLFSDLSFQIQISKTVLSELVE